MFLCRVARVVERGIDRSCGNVLERWARSYQQKRISMNPATHAPGGRVVYTTTELEFHPHSFEKILLERYNATTRKLSVSMHPEGDSGLKE
jgi:hypothetical protein